MIASDVIPVSGVIPAKAGIELGPGLRRGDEPAKAGIPLGPGLHGGDKP